MSTWINDDGSVTANAAPSPMPNPTPGMDDALVERGLRHRPNHFSAV